MSDTVYLPPGERVIYMEPDDRDDILSGVRTSRTGGLMFFGGSRGQERVYFSRESVPELIEALNKYAGLSVLAGDDA